MSKQLWLTVSIETTQHNGLFSRDTDIINLYEGFLIGTYARTFDPIFVIRTNSGKIVDNIKKENIVESKWKEIK